MAGSGTAFELGAENIVNAGLELLTKLTLLCKKRETQEVKSAVGETSTTLDVPL